MLAPSCCFILDRISNAVFEFMPYCYRQPSAHYSSACHSVSSGARGIRGWLLSVVVAGLFVGLFGFVCSRQELGVFDALMSGSEVSGNANVRGGARSSSVQASVLGRVSDEGNSVVVKSSYISNHVKAIADKRSDYLRRVRMSQKLAASEPVVNRPLMSKVEREAYKDTLKSLKSEEERLRFRLAHLF